MPILKAQQGSKLTAEQLAYLKKNNKVPYGPEDTMTSSSMHNRPITDAERTHNKIADVATGVATWGTQLREPTQTELNQGRAGGMKRLGLLARSATWGLGNELTGGLLAKALPAVANKVAGRTIKQLYYQEAPWTFKPKPGAYYHRSPDLTNVVSKEGNLQGFGSSEAGMARDAAVNSKKGINLVKNSNSDLFFSKDVPLDWGRYNKQQGYAGPYLIEAEGIPMQSASQGKRYGAAPTASEAYAVSTRPIDKGEVKYYKESLLRGYKEISSPK